MRVRTFVALACATALLPSAAPAQQQQQPTGQQMLQQMPAPGAQQPGQPMQQQAQPGQTQPMQPHPQAQNGFFTMQQTDQMLASNLMAAPVITSAGEDIGTVDDLLMDSEGRTIGVVVGIGGFLGIGTHDVAIDASQLEFVFAEELATATVPPGAAPPATTAPGTAPPAVAPPGAPAPGVRPWGWGATAGWTAGQIEFVRVPFTRAQLEAAPQFTRLD